MFWGDESCWDEVDMEDGKGKELRDGEYVYIDGSFLLVTWLLWFCVDTRYACVVVWLFTLELNEARLFAIIK